MPVIPVVAAAVFVRHSLPIVSISACSVLAVSLAPSEPEAAASISYLLCSTAGRGRVGACLRAFLSPLRRAQAKRSPEDKAVQKTLTGVSLLLVVLAFLKK